MESARAPLGCKVSDVKICVQIPCLDRAEVVHGYIRCNSARSLNISSCWPPHTDFPHMRCSAFDRRRQDLDTPCLATLCMPLTGFMVYLLHRFLCALLQELCDMCWWWLGGLVAWLSSRGSHALSPTVRQQVDSILFPSHNSAKGPVR
jgi:hypothetical protein